MVSYEFIGLIFTGLSISVSIIYYASVLANANKTQKQQLETRQAQLFMGFHTAWFNPEFYSNMIEVAFLWEYKNYDDFMEKYWMTSNPEMFTKWGRAESYLEGMGVMMKRGLLDPTLMDDLMSGYIIAMWDKYEPFMVEFRERNNQPQFGEFFEYLYREVIKSTIQDHPELEKKSMKWK
ncbi:hypothetical protein JXL21_06700 [Candidatus Bathyarchaeota archaeon]|nr:hypothetical protein [Candidatus Bathyarchaeota archaeon]